MQIVSRGRSNPTDWRLNFQQGFLPYETGVFTQVIDENEGRKAFFRKSTNRIFRRFEYINLTIRGLTIERAREISTCFERTPLMSRKGTKPLDKRVILKRKVTCRNLDENQRKRNFL